MQCKGKKYDEWVIGEKYETVARTITEADVVSFAGLSGDYNPLHTDEEYAKNTIHKTRIAHGALTFAVTTGLVNQSGITDGVVIGFMGADVKWTAPVKPGDTIRCVIEPVEKRLAKKPGRGIVDAKVSVLNQNGTVVSEQMWHLMVIA